MTGSPYRMLPIRPEILPITQCCGGWGEVLEEGQVVACPVCYPEAYGWDPPE